MSSTSLAYLPPPPPAREGWPWTEASPRLPETAPDGRPWPRITVVTPSYNQGQFIEETIRSVLLQGYPNLEYIVMDGGSTDGSVDIIRKYAKWLAHWVSEPDNGQCDAINKGMSLATGEICGWLNSDDLFQKDILREVATYWLRNPFCQFLTGDGEFVDVTGRTRTHYVTGSNYTLLDLLQYHKDKYLPQPSVFFSKGAFQSVDGLNPALAYAMDLDLWLRLRERHELYYDPLCLSKMRSHGNAKTWRDNVLAMEEVGRVVRTHLTAANPLRQANVRLGQRALLATALCRAGLNDYFSGRYDASGSALRRALQIFPPIMVTAMGAKLALRLTFPEFLKRKVFSRP